MSYCAQCGRNHELTTAGCTIARYTDEQIAEALEYADSSVRPHDIILASALRDAHERIKELEEIDRSWIQGYRQLGERLVAEAAMAERNRITESAKEEG